MLDVWECRWKRALLKPSFAPTFFQPLLWADIARCRLPGDVLKVHSDVGGVVGGVMGSMPGGEGAEPSLSSDSPTRSAASVDADGERVPPTLREMFSCGRKDVFGDLLCSSELAGR